MTSAVIASGVSNLCNDLIRAMIVLMALLASAGCASDIGYSTEFEVSAQDAGVEADALNSAVETFLGGQGVPDDTGGPLDDVGSISSQPVEKVRSNAITARVRAKRRISERLFLAGGLSVSQGTGKYALPEGVDVLTDPARISFSSTVANATIGLSHVQQHRFGLTSEVSGGAGYRVSRTNTRISSDLLAVDTTSTDGDAFVFLGAAAKVPTGRRTHVYLASRGRLYASGPVDLQVSLGLALE